MKSCYDSTTERERKILDTEEIKNLIRLTHERINNVVDWLEANSDNIKELQDKVKKMEKKK